jgi:hypothetical protein
VGGGFGGCHEGTVEDGTEQSKNIRQLTPGCQAFVEAPLKPHPFLYGPANGFGFSKLLI